MMISMSFVVINRDRRCNHTKEVLHETRPARDQCAKRFLHVQPFHRTIAERCDQLHQRSHCLISGAKDLDLTSIILRGALASDVAENIRFVENISEVISLGALGKVLG